MRSAHGTYGSTYGSAHGASSRTDKITGITVAIALHAAAIVALLQYAPARTALVNAVPLMVSLITPPAPPAPKPNVLPRPLPVKPAPRQEPRAAPPLPAPLPPLAAIPDAPSTVSVPRPPPPAPPAPIESPPVSVAAAPPAAPPAPKPATAPVVPPNFNANYLNNPAPAYPAIAKRQGHQGKVVMRVLVNAGGGADQVEIRTSSGHDLLDQAAVNAVRRWRFVPARQGELAVAAWVLVPITFTLEG